MRLTLLFLLLCTLECTNVVLGACSVSRYHEDGNGYQVKCSNMTSAIIDSGNNTPVLSVMIFQSRIPYIPASFLREYSILLVSLNLHNCGIVDIHENAFASMIYLKKLSISNNNITNVKKEWFAHLPNLQQLDLSFNRINTIEPLVFNRLASIQRLDVSENQLACLEPNNLAPMGALSKIRFVGNPLSFRCRGQLTLWLRDHGVFYGDNDHARDVWLDKTLWYCAVEDPKIAASEVLMKECVLLHLFNQLRTGLVTADSYPLSLPQQCIYTRDILTNCLVASGRDRTTPFYTNGNIIRKLLLHLDIFKSVGRL